MASTRLSMGCHDVWISVGGKEVEHFGMEIKESTKEISCWIPSEAGQKFCAGIQRTTAEFASAVDLHLDGHCCYSGTIPLTSLNRPYSISYAIVSPTESRNFKFGSLETTDDDTYLESPDSVRSIGEIKLVLHKATYLNGNAKEDFFSPPETKKVHERSMKALSHQINYGEIKRLDKVPHIGLVKRREVLGTFIFRYRPLAMLQANGIAPRDPSSSPMPQQDCPRPSTAVPLPSRKRKASEVKQESEDEDEPGDMEARENALLDRLFAFQTEIDKIRVEKAELDRLRSEKRARREEGSSSRKVKEEPNTYFTPGEVIDLT
ncbi:hypothetical protein GALMADRAFT_139861 [Galerina marginata CBS 339.88]|uniref:DUF7918 domain-containing protein n=1 Tax=Galerina marginata (strain CBS 339.88) TaxID=685588 RepID=A0A067TAU0_GALM3|nr:hypothetical protein GALMADRAFT_139861 [Galerina marginata CBS 339.88]